MDALAITGIIAGISALSVAVLTHVRHSECSKCFTLDTRTPPPTPHPLPDLHQKPPEVVEIDV